MYLGCDPHLYDARLTGTNFGLRLNYYPPMSTEDDASGAARLLGHEDIDMFTFLPAPRVEGLQVLNRRNMKWIRLNAPPGTIILNTGDYMQRISNDIFPSTTHRVSKPRDSRAAPRAARLVPDGRLSVGRRDARSPARPRRIRSTRRSRRSSSTPASPASSTATTTR